MLTAEELRNRLKDVKLRQLEHLLIEATDEGRPAILIDAGYYKEEIPMLIASGYIIQQSSIGGCVRVSWEKNV